MLIAMRALILALFLALTGCNSCTASSTCVPAHAEDTGDLARDIVGTWHLTSEPGTEGKFLQFTADGRRRVFLFTDERLSEAPQTDSGSYEVKDGILIEEGERLRTSCARVAQ